MNDCEYTCQIGAYHDGELSASAAAEVEHHLEHCTACAAELARLRALSDMLGSVTTGELPPEALHRLHEGADRLYSAGIRRMAEVMVAAAAVILIVCTARLATFSDSPRSNGTISEWEMTAVSQQADEFETDTIEQQLAAWAVRDLARKNGHD